MDKFKKKDKDIGTELKTIKKAIQQRRGNSHLEEIASSNPRQRLAQINLTLKSNRYHDGTLTVNLREFRSQEITYSQTASNLKDHQSNMWQSTNKTWAKRKKNFLKRSNRKAGPRTAYQKFTFPSKPSTKNSASTSNKKSRISKRGIS